MTRVHPFKAWLTALLAAPCLAQSPLIPSDALTPPFTARQHPYADAINAFLAHQSSYSGGFTPTGLSRADYLPLIDSITRALMQYQNASGRIIDPVEHREFQYATPAFAHCVSVLFKSGYAPSGDAALLDAGVRALTGAISAMTGNAVPDSHGDFFTGLIMQAFENFKGIVPAATQSAWRTGIAAIAPGTVYRNSAPNWIGFNVAGEFLRYKEGVATLDWTQSRIAFQATRMGANGLYQDQNTIDTATAPVANIDGNSFAYDNVARAELGIIARGGYTGTYSAELNRALWKGGWTGLLYQSPAGEVPTGMRSSHHLWNEGFAAANYEMWAVQYKLAGRPDIAGAFKRAAMLSLAAEKSWLRPDGSGYITKARYAPALKWGYMSYSGLTNYGGLAASILGTAWQIADSAIAERPAPADIGGYVLPILYGFKKIFASAGGTYAEYDIRGDQSHNPTGLIRVHLKTSLPQLGPSDGVIAGHIQGAQYWPLYPTADPPGLPTTGIGPGWNVNGTWKTLGALQRIPAVTILEQTPERASFRASYSIDSGSTLNETVVVEPGGVTVTDSVSGGGINGLRIYYPMLRTDGERQSTVQVDGNAVTLGLRGKGARFSVLRPAVDLVRTNVLRNHRNGQCELIQADVGRVAQYRVTAWPAYAPVAVRGSRSSRMAAGPVIGYDGAFLRVEGTGKHRAEIRSLSGRLVWSRSGWGAARYDLRGIGRGQGVLLLAVAGGSGRAIRKIVR